jgi:rhodanese-related sulfurtransferase
MPKLKPKELQALLKKNPAPFVLLDIREAAEYAEGHIAGAVNIPLSNFSTVSGQIPAGTRIILYCATGARNYSAYRQLRRLGYSDISQAVLEEWEEAGLVLEGAGGAAASRN